MSSLYRFFRQSEYVNQKELSESTGVPLDRIRLEESYKIKLSLGEYKKIKHYLNIKETARIARFDKKHKNYRGVK